MALTVPPSFRGDAAPPRLRARIYARCPARHIGSGSLVFAARLPSFSAKRGAVSPRSAVAATTADGTGIPGGVGGGAGYESHVLFYVGVPDVEAALRRAESLGGKRRMGPERAPSGLVVGHFTDPEGNLIGVAGPA